MYDDDDAMMLSVFSSLVKVASLHTY